MENNSEPRMDANKVKNNGKMSCPRAMTSEPAPVEESFEMNPHWITVTIRDHTRSTGGRRSGFCRVFSVLPTLTCAMQHYGRSSKIVTDSETISGSAICSYFNDARTRAFCAGRSP